jgi:hypothetical protein
MKPKTGPAPMTRRKFLLGVTVSLAAVGSLRGWRDIVAQVDDFFRNPEAARRIGKQLSMTGAALKVPFDDNLDLEQRHLVDFQNDKISIIDGWICSHSEAEICVQMASTKPLQETNHRAG